MSVRLAALVALFTWAVCRISWPGFMSYDSMYALRQARMGIENGGYPPMVSYLWALCEQFIPGQGGMFVVQNALVFFGVAALARALGASDFRILLAMLVTALAPVTLGPMLVVWKDVAFGGLMAIAYAITLHYVEQRRRAMLAAALLSLALASSLRLNGIAAAAPALAAIAWMVCRRSQPAGSRLDAGGGWPRLLASTLAFAFLVAATFGFVALTASWRLPDFKRIPMATGSGWTQLHDLIGISVCAGRNLLPPSLDSGDMSLERLRRIYRPEHSQLSIGPSPLLDEFALSANASLVQEHSTKARIEHPMCYLLHRARVLMHAVGANPGPVFYLTDAGVFPGEAGTEMTPTDLTASMISYIQQQRSSVFARGIFFGLLALGALVAAGRGAQRPRMWKALLPMAGACTYLLGSFLVLPGADARYNFWANLVFIVTFCSILPGFAAKKSAPLR
jgi:hypothetical protein